MNLIKVFFSWYFFVSTWLSAEQMRNHNFMLYAAPCTMYTQPHLIRHNRVVDFWFAETLLHVDFISLDDTSFHTHEHPCGC